MGILFRRRARACKQSWGCEQDSRGRAGKGEKGEWKAGSRKHHELLWQKVIRREVCLETRTQSGQTEVLLTVRS